MLVGGVLVLALLTGVQGQAPSASASSNRVRAHIEFLASDLLQGREPGTPGFDIAAEYVASQFRELGLTPAGDRGGYFQRVPLFAYRLKDRGSFTLRDAGRTVSLTFGDDYIPGRVPVAGKGSDAEARVRVSGAPMVFAGFGVVAPQHKRDDYAGLDVRGKVVVVIAGAPLDYPTEERAYYVSSRTKRAEAAKHGAIGLISVNTPAEDTRTRFADGARTWDAWAMTWRQSSGEPYDPVPSVPNLATLSAAGGRKLFERAPVPFTRIVAAAESKRRMDLPHFPLNWSFDGGLTIESKAVESRNVAGLIQGSDPSARNEVVVLSAHLDHIGVTAPVNRDSINNGALDNAAGVATTLEVARTFVDAPQRPRRSVLVLAVTAEEKGLIGSEYFARNPTIPRERIVADVDLDMPILRYDFTDVIAFGAERSTVGDAVRKAAGRMNVRLTPDPMPEEGLFTRSDHYRFVEVGVPAVFLMTGFANGGEKQFRDFLATCYHRPCDDTAHPIDYNAGAKFARINYEIARELADAPGRPSWKPKDFFGEMFARPGAPR